MRMQTHIQMYPLLYNPVLNWLTLALFTTSIGSLLQYEAI